jgi:hypothetical protein
VSPFRDASADRNTNLNRASQWSPFRSPGGSQAGQASAGGSGKKARAEKSGGASSARFSFQPDDIAQNSKGSDDMPWPIPLKSAKNPSLFIKLNGDLLCSSIFLNN